LHERSCGEPALLGRSPPNGRGCQSAASVRIAARVPLRATLPLRRARLLAPAVRYGLSSDPPARGGRNDTTGGGRGLYARRLSFPSGNRAMPRVQCADGAVRPADDAVATRKAVAASESEPTWQ
jgi:hypothetical protein